MQIIRVINNNVVCALNERHQERILIGKGIGFQKKPGDEVDKGKAEKEYFKVQVRAWQTECPTRPGSFGVYGNMPGYCDICE